MLPRYGFVGLLIILTAKPLMFMRVEPVATWFTPIVWTGYILFADSLVLKLSGRSLIVNQRRQFLMMIPLSVGFWLIFEYYNLYLRNWYYVNLPEQLWLREIGFFWSFATIMPGLFETADLLKALGTFAGASMKKVSLTRSRLYVSIAVGLIFLAGPLFLPYSVRPYTFGFVWLGFFLLLAPVNYILDGHSLLEDWERGNWERTYCLLASGLICGLLWEFWNYWATAKWIYAVPILSEVKIFEMPLLGFLGFPPFALEYFEMYNFASKSLKGFCHSGSDVLQ
ncbi:MAG: hypothetical protein ACE5NP_13830 [Anaerolineae bacterium]